MYVVLGATGHVGSVVADHLLDAQRPVTIVTRSREKAALWQRKGAVAAVADIYDAAALEDVFRKASRVFLLNPPARVSEDTDTVERQSVGAILTALNGVQLEKIVFQSTYGAQPGPHCGDMGVLYELEEGVRSLGVPTCCLRAAYYMSNWIFSAKQARETGEFSTLLPVGLKVPMVAPQDVGVLAARLLMSEVTETGLYACEGPSLYAPQDVATVLGRVVGRPVSVCEIPSADWLPYYRENGFSEQAAQSYAHMTKLFISQPHEQAGIRYKGSTGLEAYFKGVFGA